jgi:Ca2+-binding RTX toxin-like protein
MMLAAMLAVMGAVFATAAFAATIVGTNKADFNLKGTDQADTIRGRGLRGPDAILGKSGDDEMHGGRGADFIVGHLGKDKLYGEGGEDQLVGLHGADTFYAKDGFIDYVICGHGEDTVYADVKLDEITKDCETVKGDPPGAGE